MNNETTPLEVIGPTHKAKTRAKTNAKIDADQVAEPIEESLTEPPTKQTIPIRQDAVVQEPDIEYVIIIRMTVMRCKIT